MRMLSLVVVVLLLLVLMLLPAARPCNCYTPASPRTPHPPLTSIAHILGHADDVVEVPARRRSKAAHQHAILRG